ncbi:MAG: hypothetical protein WC562_08130 [Dehalococcoidia bacterium]
MTMEQSSAFCPYCNFTLKKPPQRKAKCPSCGNFMYIRTLPTTRERVIVTESRAKEIDTEWATSQSRQKWMQILSSYGTSETDYEREKGQLTKKFGHEAKDRDVIWSLFNRLITIKRDLHSLKTLNYEMAVFLDEENRDFRPLLEQAAKMDLLQYKKLNVVKVEILSAGIGNSCEGCQKQHGKIYTIDEALRLMPIPCKDCTRTLNSERKGFCRCKYVAAF